MKRVVVVGSGLAGLSAAYRLHEQGCQVTVLEALDRVGGAIVNTCGSGSQRSPRDRAKARFWCDPRFA